MKRVITITALLLLIGAGCQSSEDNQTTTLENLRVKNGHPTIPYQAAPTTSAPAPQPTMSRQERILWEDGYENIVLGGPPIWGCSDDDSFINSNDFTATKNGHAVKGVVCCGWFKDCTVRRR